MKKLNGKISIVSAFKYILLFFAVISIFLHNLTLSNNSAPTHRFFKENYRLESNLAPAINAENTKILDGDDVTIFYNIYIPDERYSEVSIDKVQSIIQEQLKSRASSIYPESRLNYITIGREMTEPLNCTSCFHLEHNDIGDEYQSLTKVHEFCKNNPHLKVAYIHNKGSYHPSQENNLLRRMLTKAVFSEECLRLASTKKSENQSPHKSCSKCNICGSRFSPLPHFHVSGNMWVAECNYIAKLLPPLSFENEMNNVVLNAPRTKFGDTQQLTPAFVGRDRYSAEHWAFSHPDICPCDVYPGKFTWSYERIPENDDWEPDFVMAPRFSSAEEYATVDLYKEQRSYDPEGNWFSLAGRMHEWKTLYGKLPKHDSWVWSFYNNSGSYRLL